MTGARLDAPAFHRNRAPIVETLRPILGTLSGDALEIGCGSGQHAAAFAGTFPKLRFWPTDPDPRHRASADAWRDGSGLANLMTASELDAAAPDWNLGSDGWPPADPVAIYAFNVIHISPWRVAEGIVAGAGRHLGAGGRLILYGPYKRAGAHTADSNARFDETLRARDPDWGVRDLENVVALAEAAGLNLDAVHEMPANNLTVVFRRSDPAT